MICPVICAETPEALLAEHCRLVVEGAQLVEWRLDCIQGSIDLPALLRERPGPIIVTIRLPHDGGKWQGDESQRRELLSQAIEAGAEYVDLEPEAAEAIPRRRPTRRIVSMHDFLGTPDDLTAIQRRLESYDADIVKLATMARSTHDAFRMLELVARSGQTVGLCMGELGTPTRLLAMRWGAPFSYAAPDDSKPPAPGQLSVRTMRDLYHAEEITAETNIYGVIGDPIGHSKSPLIHNAALRHLGLNAVYVPFRVPPADLLSFLDDIRRLNDSQNFRLRGLSVTIPHKEGILARITDPDEAVREIGAANTMVFDGAKVYGYNTDRWAAIDSLAVATGQGRGASPRFDGLAALVLGAGGAAKAIAHGLQRCGAKVTITGRTRARAEEVASPLGCGVADWDDRHQIAADVLVNCTPLGMSPHVDATPIEPASLRSEMIVFDTVYNPEITQLLADARERGCRIVTGVEMFIRQAARQFELFTGHEAPVDVMRNALSGKLC
jgi:3-dehydroquinate dehydratase/shikimate dehydrogenase